MTALLRVPEVLKPKDFYFPIFLDERDDSDAVVLECCTIRGSPQARPLCGRYVLLYDETKKMYV